MVKVKDDLTGKKFGSLTVVEQSEDYIENGRAIAGWIVYCECNPDRKFRVRQKDLKKGHTTSCGCLRKKKTIEANYKRKGVKRGSENEYDLSGEYGIGYTNSGETFLFDLEDFDLIRHYHWFIDRHGYVTANTDYHPIRMHRLIMGVTDKNIQVDHIYHDTTDNRKSQLRLCKNEENARNCKLSKNNTSGTTGVYYDTTRDKWHAQIRLNGKNIFLGRYNCIEDAVVARKIAEQEYFGEFAYQEKPE